MLGNKGLQLVQHALGAAKGLLGHSLAQLSGLFLSQSGTVSVDLLHNGIHISLLLDQLLLVSFPELLNVDAITITIIVAQIVQGGKNPVGGSFVRELRIVEDFFNVVNVRQILALEDLRGIRQQVGIERQIDRELGPGHSLPLNGGQRLGHIGTNLEHMALRLPMVADGIAVALVGVIVGALTAVSQEAQHVIGAHLAVRIKQQGGRLGQPGAAVVIAHNGILLGQLRIHIVDALPVPLILGFAEILGAVGLGNVDLRDLRHTGPQLGGNQETLFLRQGDQPGRSDHILLVGDVDLVHDHHVGVERDLVCGHPHCHILVAGQRLEVPDLICVADGKGVALTGPVFIEDGRQLFHAVPGGLRLHQDHSVQGDFAQAGIDQRIIPQIALIEPLIFAGFLVLLPLAVLQQLGVVSGGDGGAHSHALFVHTDFTVSLIDLIAVFLIEGLTGLDRITHYGVAISMGGIGHGEPVGVHIHLALLMVGGRTYLEHLIVQLADILGTTHIGRTVFRYFAADVHASARSRTDGAAHHQNGGEQGGAEPCQKLLIHVISPSFINVPLYQRTYFNISSANIKIKDKCHKIYCSASYCIKHGLFL